MCEAYGDRPSDRIGLFDRGDPAHLYDSLHFDMAVRMRANLAAKSRREEAEKTHDDVDRKRSDAQKGLLEVIEQLEPGSPYRRHLEKLMGGSGG